MANPQWNMNVQAKTHAAPIHTDEVAALMLDPEGRIRDCNETAEELFGFHHDELVTKPIESLFPQLSDIEWLQNGLLNPRLSYFCHIGRQFNAIRRDGTRFASRLFFNELHNREAPHLRLLIRRTDNLA